ncbi:hypothetical protein P167DRAFT_105447 [Morchella conica CCBAS932]|uniref:Uncharacterized protein n=1 Tax=Morchella conica CCBAS932 TaxID=1392247 RepID=A0A3N4KSW4_9PEZI|nr:hypothetical protein P167DRAFT_105447 [Morchella conica CCBAS932]
MPLHQLRRHALLFRHCLTHPPHQHYPTHRSHTHHIPPLRIDLRSLPIPSSNCACCVVVSGTSRSMLPSLRRTTIPSGAAASSSASAWSAAAPATVAAGMLLALASVEGPVRERERKSVRRTSVADLARGGGGALDMM